MVYNFFSGLIKTIKLKTIIMKTTVKIAGLLLMILLAFSGTLNAQRGMRGNGMRTDSLRTREFRPDLAPGRMTPRGQFNDQRQMYGMRHGMGMGPIAGMGRGAGNNFSGRSAGKTAGGDEKTEGRDSC